MSHPVVINTKLIDSLVQIILSLTEEERQLLVDKIQVPLLSGEVQHQWKVLQSEIAVGAEQLQHGDYTEYDAASLPSLLDTIRERSKQRLQAEQSQ